MREPCRSTSGPCQERFREALPLCSAGTSVSTPVPASHRVPHCCPRSRLSPSVSWRGAPLPDLSGEDYPAVCLLNQLRRDPHILGWFAHLRSHPALGVGRLRL